MVFLKANLQSNPDSFLIEISNSDDNQGIKPKVKPIEVFDKKKSMANCLDSKVEKEVIKNPTDIPIPLYPSLYQQKKLGPEDISTKGPINQQLKHKDLIYHAIKMERARLKLTHMLVDNIESLKVLAKEYIVCIDKGSEQSEMLSFNNKQNLEPIQEKNFVQVSAKEFKSNLNVQFQKILSISENKSQLTDEVVADIYQIHFLPAFLHIVATQIINSKSVKARYKTQINKQDLQMMQSRQIIVEGNLRLVSYVAKQFKQTRLPFSDLVQEGTIGLIKAIDRFDYSRSVKFSTYAIYWIRQTISRVITRQEKTIRIPFNIAAKVSVVFEAMNLYLQQTGKWPSSDELSELCQLSKHEVETILEYCQPTVSLFNHVNNDPNMPDLIETIEQHHFKSPFNTLSSQALRKIIKNAIHCLPYREADVLCMRFGLNNRQEMTLQEIADQLYLSRERVRQIQNAALKKIRNGYAFELKDFLTPSLA